VPRVKAHADIGQSALDAIPNRRVILAQSALSGEVEVNPLARPDGSRSIVLRLPAPR
jgi:hypothetical protein